MQEQILVSTGDTQEILDVIREFGFNKLTIAELETFLYALSKYIKMKRLGGQ